MQPYSRPCKTIYVLQKYTNTETESKMFDGISDKDVINECYSHIYLKLPSEMLPVTFQRFVCKL